MGGVWVFPGGAVDASEGEGDVALPRRRGARARRGGGRTLDDPAALVPFSRWITPAEVKIRFDTWFFLAPAPDGAEPAIDGEEAVDARLVHAAGRARRAPSSGEILLVFPTIKHLEQLAPFASADELLDVRPRARGAPGAAEDRHGRRDRARRAARRAGLDEVSRTRGMSPQPRGIRPAGSGDGPHRRRHRPHRRDRQAVHPGARAHARGQAHPRHGAPPVRPVLDGLAQDRVPPGRRARTATTSTRSSRTPTSSSTWRSSCSARATAPATSTSRARATSSRPPSTPRASKRLVYTSSVAAYGFHDENPLPLTEDVPARGHRRAPVQRAEGRARGGAARGRSSGAEDRHLRLPPVHRRRAARRGCSIEAIPYVRLGDQLPGAVRRAVRPGPDPQAGHPRPRRAVPARPPRRRRQRAEGRRARQGRARRLQPRRRRRDHDERPRRRAGLVLGPGPRARASTRPPRSSRAAVHARRGDVGQRRPRPRCSWTRRKARKAAALAARSTPRARRCSETVEAHAPGPRGGARTTQTYAT